MAHPAGANPDSPEPYGAQGATYPTGGSFVLSHPPFAGPATVVQAFGANAAANAAASCGDVPLRGHEGIDFALAPGTPVLAVQQGAVLSMDRSGSHPRHGRYVLLGHTWGQSLYANL
ncbi:MAG: peptidoglycan DD-metalloendopeptidase family protein, partial [Caldilineaceae bacterium]